MFGFCEFLYQDEGIHISLRSENDMYSGRQKIVDAEEMELYKWFDEDNPKLLYNYDFYDDRLHEIVLEEIFEYSDSESPKCIAGKGACPPEDCGRTYGYERIKYVLESNDAPKEVANIRKWLGLKKDELLDIKYFDIDDANERIKAL